MELRKRVSNYPVVETEVVNTASFKPSSYKQMDDWLNSFSTQAWTALLGAYTAGGYQNVVVYMRNRYADNLVKWKDKDLRHFWDSREWTDFKTRHERSVVAA